MIDKQNQIIISQRSLLESGDNDETNETDENKVLDNNEINKILTRGDDELKIFRD